uniref:SAP domain-containing protein n=1 Tax=Lepeophtheirus salmonis TaxID=72036 RepID=A0A0K2TQ45_LEPSM
MEDYKNWTLKDLRSELKRRNAHTSDWKHEVVILLQSSDRNCNFSSFSSAPVPTVDTMYIFPDISIFRTVTEASLSEF